MEGAAYLTFYFCSSVPVRHTDLYLSVCFTTAIISSKGRCSFFPLPFPLFQSQVGHSLMRQVAAPLSPKMNCMHCDITPDLHHAGVILQGAK